MGAWNRVRRSVAQRGLRNMFANVWRRVRTGDFAAPVEAPSRTSSHPFDEATGMDTAGLIHGSALATGHPHDLYSVTYYGTAPSLFQAVIEQWGGTPAGTTFIDIGCGKGRVVLLASELGFAECVGVELNPGLAAIARANIAKWDRAKSPIRIECADATTLQFPAGRCLVYLFNPFTGKVLEKLLDHIAKVFEQRPGELEILYVNAEFSDVLQAHAGFEKMWEMPVRMSAEDAAVDLLYLADESGKKTYGETGEERCSGWRWVGL